jgi:uncharacterized protein (DUF2062 family)
VSRTFKKAGSAWGEIVALFKRRIPLTWIQKLGRFVWPKQGFKRSVRYLAHRLKRLPATPHAIAAGCASGAAMSFLPLVGLHFILSFGLAWLVRGNMIAAALGTAVGNPLTFPIIYSSAYRLGRQILSFGATEPPGEPDIDIKAESEALMATGLDPTALERLLPMWEVTMAGAAPMALVAFAVCYALVYNFAARFQAGRAHKRGDRRFRAA